MPIVTHELTTVNLQNCTMLQGSHKSKYATLRTTTTLSYACKSKSTNLKIVLSYHKRQWIISV